MALNTAGDLVSFALRTAGINGVGQTPSAEDSNDGLILLTSLVAQWSRKRWLVWDLIDVVLKSTGAQSYTIGPAGDFVCARPDRLESAFARFLNTTGPNLVDYKLSVVDAREDYNSISIKTLVTLPRLVFYDSAWPVGSLFFWPVPPANQYELHVNVKAPLPTYTSLATPLNLPPEYASALIYSLAVRLCMNYGQDPKASLVGAMREALNTIRMANTQVAELAVPNVGGRGTGSIAASSSPQFQSGTW